MKQIIFIFTLFAQKQVILHFLIFFLKQFQSKHYHKITMRSLIKMQISRYPDKEVNNIHNDGLRRSGVMTQQASREPNKINFVTKQNYRWLQHDVKELQQNKKRKKKQFINKIESIDEYVSCLTNELENYHEQSDLNQTKFKLLKRIIENYDIKNMQRNDYSKLIKNFGLKIETAKTCEKKGKNERPKSRNFTIKPKTNRQSQSSRLKQHRTINQSSLKVGIFQFSDEAEVIKTEKSKQEQSARKRLDVREKINSFNAINRKSYLSSSLHKNKRAGLKKQTPFKYKSRMDVISQKVHKYRHFLFLLNLTNNIYRDLSLVLYEEPLKFYIGRGNNQNMLRSLLKKRFWFQQTKHIEEANFIWTQIKSLKIFSKQKKGQKPFSEIICKEVERSNMKKSFSMDKFSPDNFHKILSKRDLQLYKKMKFLCSDKPPSEFIDCIKYWDKPVNFSSIQQSDRIHNHLACNGLLGNKKGMFYSLNEFYKITGKNIFDYVPETFHISKGILDENYTKFISYFQQRRKKRLCNIWIMKPGQFSNRGQGIICSNKLDEIKKRVLSKEKHEERTLILQLYIANPLLYHNRKFDLRVFMLITMHNGKVKGYWYNDGYARTSSFQFDLTDIGDTEIHLTNDAIQKQSELYGKFEPANKLSFTELQRYFDTLSPYGRNLDIFHVLIPQMKEIAKDLIKSSFLFLDQDRHLNNFELFGLDFMVDYNFHPWLIEVNTNPCLELNCPLMERILPFMVENTLRIGLDPIFPPPSTVPHHHKYGISENAISYNKFSLIFDEERDGPEIEKNFLNNPQSLKVLRSLMKITQDQQQYQEEGEVGNFDL